ncbi:unnamed protein product [Ectocarpus sp. 13 AM-2016]
MFSVPDLFRTSKPIHRAPPIWLYSRIFQPSIAVDVLVRLIWCEKPTSHCFSSKTLSSKQVYDISHPCIVTALEPLQALLPKLLTLCATGRLEADKKAQNPQCPDLPRSAG